MPREWNATEYHRLSSPQTVWGARVLERLRLGGHERVIDAGCGTGRLTAMLLERLPEGRVLCLDRSFNMLRVARETLEPRFGRRVGFVHADLTAVPLREWADVAFSTATFHWVLDHARLFSELFEALRPGGRLVAQCGAAGNLAGLHARAARLTESAAYRELFDEWVDPWEFADADTTRVRLEAAGFEEVVTSVEEAPTKFDGPREFADFVTTVVLRPFLERIPRDDARRRFVERLTDEAADDSPPFLLDYRRLNLQARKPA